MQDSPAGIAFWAVRYSLGILGGYLTAKGYVDDATWQSVVGAIITLSGAVASIIARQKALATPPKPSTAP